MIASLTPAQVRAAEAPLVDGGRGPALMAAAARGLAALCLAELRAALGRVYGRRAVILVGPGNNGGDALYAGAALAGRGVAVTAVAVLGSTAHVEGLAALLRAGGRLAGREEGARLLARADLVVDGILGTGARPGLPGDLAALIEAWQGDRPAHQRVVACDTPSGIDATTGTVPGPAVRADATATFAAAKTGLIVPPAAELAGRLVVVDIGLPLDPRESTVEQLGPADVAERWPVPRASDQKYTRGVVGILAGSPQYPGAAVLATSAALSAGAGLARTVMDPSVSERVGWTCPEAVAGEGRVQSWVVGPGAPDSSRCAEILGGVLEHDPARTGTGGERVLAVVDAGALEHIGPAREGDFLPFVLTPHAGELSALLGRLDEDDATTRAQVEAHPLDAARRAARLAGAIVLLKGSRTLVATPEGHVVVAGPASPWLATAGSGDVLAGAIGAALATAGITAHTSAREIARLVAAASVVHARAAELIGGPVRASHLADALGPAIASLLGEGGGRPGPDENPGAGEPRSPR